MQYYCACTCRAAYVHYTVFIQHVQYMYMYMYDDYVHTDIKLWENVSLVPGPTPSYSTFVH